MQRSTLLLASIGLVLSACVTSPALVIDPVCVAGGGGDGRPFFQIAQTNFNVRGLPDSCDLVTFGCNGDRLVEIERVSNTAVAMVIVLLK